MSDETYVFFDFDNTLSDFDSHRAQYVGRLARLLAYETKDEAAAWATALKQALPASVERYDTFFRNNPPAGYNAWLETERVVVSEDIFREVGKPYSLREPIGEFAKRIQFDALVDCNAIFPGIPHALQALFNEGFRLQMASSQESDYLLAALMGGGIESMIESKFGPDLVDCAKEGPEFFERVFSELGLPPERAIVVDDLAVCLDWARQAGARTLQVRFTPSALGPELPNPVRDVRDLPKRIHELIVSA